jgi:uncharacterized RDD family membrane protein YckC
MNSPNPYAPPKADVRDIAGPSENELAGRFIRLVTAILDSIILGALVYTPVFFSMGAAGLAGLARGDRSALLHALGIGGLLALVGLGVWIWLTVLFVSRNGQTIGKKLIGIKVVRKDGSKASLGRIFWLRNVVNTILAIIPFYGLIDILLIFSESRQCIHDRIADTIVVKA